MKRRRSVILTWIITYIIVWCVPFGFSVMNYYSAERQLQNNIDEINRLAVKSAANEIVNIFLQQSKSIDEFAQEDLFKSLQTMSGTEFYGHRDQARAFVDVLSKMRTYNEYIDNVSVIFQQLDTVISSGGFCQKNSFWQAYLQDTDLSEEGFQKVNSEFHTGTFLRLKRKSSIGNSILFVKSIEGRGVYGYQNVFVIMNEKLMLNDFIKNKFISNGIFIALKQDDSIMFANCGDELCELMAEKIKQTDDNLLKLEVDGKEYFAVIEKMNINSVTYIYMIEKATFYNGKDFFVKMSWAGMIACLIFGMAIIIYFVKKNYNPIHEIVGAFESGNSSRERYENEYEYIKHNISAVMTKLDSAQKSLRRGQQSIVEFELHKILHGEFSEYMDQFKYDHFMIAYACIDDCENIFFENTQPNGAANNMYEAKFIIKNILTELMSEFCDVYIIEYDVMVGFIMNFSGQEDIIHQYQQAAVQAERIIKSKFNVSFSMLNSEIHVGELGPTAAYRQICDMITYRNAMAGEPINISYDDLNRHVGGGQDVLLYYPILQEQKLIHSMQMGDVQNSIKGIREIFDVNLKKNTPIYVLHGLQCCIAGTLTKVLVNLQIKDEEILEQVKQAVDELRNLDLNGSQEEAMETITGYVEFICRITAEKEREEVKSPYVTQTVQYVNEHYADSSLSINQIASHLGIHKDYVSRLFKAEKNMSVLEYINSVRMKHAVEYLVSTDLPIIEIANKVGINNIQSFNRTFKSMMGMPPGQYRSSMK